MRFIYYLVLIFVALIGVTFATLNAEIVSFNYYFGKVNLALSLLLVYFLAIGLVLGLIASIFPLLKCKKRNFQLKRQVNHMEKEIENLRTMPIKNSH